VGFAHVSFFFAVDAATILLAVQSQRLGYLQSPSPSLPKIFVIKWNPYLLSDALPGFLDLSMILMGALEKGA
jgi:hypothetical protein